MKRALASPRVLWIAAIAALLWLAPATLTQRYQADDYYHRIYLARDASFAPFLEPAHRLFTFYDGDPARTAWARSLGIVPWWTDPGLRSSFLRPVSAAAHGLDFRLWPGSPALAHLHSLLWYGVVLLLAGLAYRRFLGGRAAWVAGLATVLYAFDHTHGVDAAWIANRNAMVAAAFGLAALYAHDRWRREGARAAGVLAPLALGLALFAGEAGLGALAYLVAYEATQGGARRLRALVPTLLVTAAWAVIYVGGHHGATGSGMYVDPLSDPLGFARAAATHAPLLLASELGGPTPDIYMFLAPTWQLALLALALGVLAFAAPALVRLARGDATTRFFLLGALLAVLPTCATTPSARVMLLPGFGLIGVLARLGADVLERVDWVARLPRAARAGIVAYAVLAVGGHAVLSPLLLQVTARQMVMFDGVLRDLARGVPDDVRGQRVVIVNAPDAFFAGYLLIERHGDGQPAPRALLVLGVGRRALELERLDERTLRVRAPDGFYRDGADVLTTRGDRAMPVGTRVAIGDDVTIEVMRTAPDGVPVEADFRFAAPLPDARLRFVRWQGATYVPFELPAAGARVAIPAQPLPMPHL